MGHRGHGHGVGSGGCWCGTTRKARVEFEVERAGIAALWALEVETEARDVWKSERTLSGLAGKYAALLTLCDSRSVLSHAFAQGCGDHGDDFPAKSV